MVMAKAWGNPEGVPVYCSFSTAQLWREVDRVTCEYIRRPENQKIITDYVFGRVLLLERPPR
jgi:hypothetical protein